MEGGHLCHGWFHNWITNLGLSRLDREDIARINRRLSSLVYEHLTCLVLRILGQLNLFLLSLCLALLLLTFCRFSRLNGVVDCLFHVLLLPRKAVEQEEKQQVDDENSSYYDTHQLQLWALVDHWATSSEVNGELQV